jgi:uncharacterized phage protein (TIGR01671 family)
MEREIKFEYGFNSVNGTIKKVYHLHEIPNIQQKCDVWNVLPIKYVREFTGLKDKNGKEIYEGDIVKTPTDKPMVISWSKKFASFVIDRDGWMFSHWFGEGYNGEDVEVIGNIYDNPELIK